MGEVAGAFDGAPVVGIEIGVKVWAFVVDHETQVGDLVALGGEHFFVEGLDLEESLDRGLTGNRAQGTIRKVSATSSVKIVGASKNLQPILLGHRAGIFIQEATVCLEVDYSAFFQELAVTLKEKWARQAAVFAFHLGVREGQPYFRNLIGSEEGIDELNSCAKERNVRKIVLRGELCTLPKARAFDVHPDVVERWLPARKINGVLPFSATELKHDRLLGSKHLLVPVPLDRMILEFQTITRIRLIKHRSGLWLKKAGESLVLRKFSKFVVSHYYLVNITPTPLIDSESLSTLALRRQTPCSGKTITSL